MKKIILILLFIILLIISFFWGFYIKEIFILKTNKNENIHSFDNKYKFINPLLDCESNFNFISTKTIEFKINKYLENNNKINKIWLFFRFLKNGSIFWINENDNFLSASLTKLPLAIVLFKLSETKEFQNILENEIIIEDIKIDLDRNLWQDNIKIWEKYKIIQLIEQMLINSDNLAAIYLIAYVWENLNTVYKELWIKEIDFNNPYIDVSAKDISMFLRILYNASYLNRENSEKILYMLSKSNFTSWLKAGVPKNILISNKFWEKWFKVNPEKQLHDCWIIYYPNNPYILCVMTRWDNFSDLSNVIKDISNIVYREISILN